jgi:hypothetical protein
MERTRGRGILLCPHSLHFRGILLVFTHFSILLCIISDPRLSQTTDFVHVNNGNIFHLGTIKYSFCGFGYVLMCDLECCFVEYLD